MYFDQFASIVSVGMGKRISDDRAGGYEHGAGTVYCLGGFLTRNIILYVQNEYLAILYNVIFKLIWKIIKKHKKLLNST